MIVIKPSNYTEELTLIPRRLKVRTCDVLLIDELEATEYHYKDVVVYCRNGFLSFVLPYIFNHNDKYYSIDLKDEEEYIYRGKIWVTNDDDLQNFDEEK